MNLKIRAGATYDQVLLLLADLDSVYGIRGEGTAGGFFILETKKRSA